MAKRIILKADDLGISKKTDEGIFKLATIGTVTSGSLMVNSSRAKVAFIQAQKINLSVGTHLNTTAFEPLPPIRSEYIYLFGTNGKIKRAFENKTGLDTAEFEQLFSQFDNQIKFFQTNF